jgi:archaellum component FlaF (FlaF/FlaG flagellin family)
MKAAARASSGRARLGFDATATHLVWFAALVVAASAAVQGALANGERLEDAREARDARVEGQLGTRLRDVSFCYDAPSQTLNATAVNRGVTLDAGEVTLVAEGVVVAGPEARVWGGAPGDRVWRQDETASWEKTPFAPAPTRVVLYAGNGVAAWAAPACP